MKTTEIRSATSGKVYEVRKMRTPSSHYLSTYHYRRLGDDSWQSLSLDTLAQVRTALHADGGLPRMR
jgi:hypothetical protein